MWKKYYSSTPAIKEQFFGQENNYAQVKNLNKINKTSMSACLILQ